jgi:hypothetical protein
VTSSSTSIPPLSRTDQVVFSVLAIVVAAVVVGTLVYVDVWARLTLLAGVPVGVVMMRGVSRLPWGFERGRALRPIQITLVTVFLLSIKFDLPALTAALVGGFAGLTAYTYTCNVRSGRLRFLGVWPREHGGNRIG